MITQDYQTVGPAYGRDYRSAREAIADFNANMDFVMLTMGHNGTYCSKRDFQPGVHVMIRYSQMRKVVDVKVEVKEEAVC